MSLSDALHAHEQEIVRWLRLTAGWSEVEKARVLIGWLGTGTAKEMNDFLEKKEQS